MVIKTSLNSDGRLCGCWVTLTQSKCASDVLWNVVGGQKDKMWQTAVSLVKCAFLCIRLKHVHRLLLEDYSVLLNIQISSCHSSAAHSTPIIFFCHMIENFTFSILLKRRKSITKWELLLWTVPCNSAHVSTILQYTCFNQNITLFSKPNTTQNGQIFTAPLIHGKQLSEGGLYTIDVYALTLESVLHACLST